jgi:hypothetical protein
MVKPISRRSVWSETLPYDRLTRGLLSSLAERGIELLLAVRPDDLPSLPGTLEACESARVRVALWPMIDDRDGRWASVGTMAAYCDFVDALLPPPGALLRSAEVVFDLEPPIGDVRAALDAPGSRALLAGGLGRLHGAVRGDPGRTRQAAARLGDTIARLAAREVEVSAAIVPVLLADGPGAGLEALLDTPVSGQPWSRLHAMMYTSLVEGYAPRLAARADCLSLLDLGCRRAASLPGLRAAVSLGVVAPGALGDERPYRDVDALREDIAVTRAAGIDDIALFDLGGVAQRGPVEPWLDALVDTPPAPSRPPRTARAVAACALLAAAGASLGAISIRK